MHVYVTIKAGLKVVPEKCTHLHYSSHAYCMYHAHTQLPGIQLFFLIPMLLEAWQNGVQFSLFLANGLLQLGELSLAMFLRESIACQATPTLPSHNKPTHYLQTFSFWSSATPSSRSFTSNSSLALLLMSSWSSSCS